MKTIWGFDLGVTSVGFAVLKWDEWASADGIGDILRLGVRIFPEAREKDLSPKNAARRQARLMRRQRRRRRWRRVHLRALLAGAGLLPAADARPSAGQDPYALRARGVTGVLATHELGWALFHLLKRRGFRGSRKRPETKDATKDEKEAQSRGQALSAKLDGRKLGEYLAEIETSIGEPKRRRGVGQTRPMVQDELDALWAAQRRYHPDRLTDDLRDQIEQIALRQRPTFFRSRTFGQCELEPSEPRALKAEWTTQHFETLQLVNALRVEGGNQRSLDASERARAVAYLESAAKPTWAGLRQALGLSRQDRFTHERGKKETVRGNATELALRRELGPKFGDLPSADAIRTAIGNAWHRVEYRPVNGGAILEIRDVNGIEAERTQLAARAETEWGLSPPQAAALARIDLPDGTGRHSLAAMRRLLPRLEAGEPYMTAVRSEYGQRESGAPVDRLPGPNPSEVQKLKDEFVKRRMQALLAGIRNPTVLRTLGELQKVVNALLRAYGRPDLIRLEMARDLKRSAEERRETDSQQSRRERARTAARSKLLEMGKAADSREGAENVLRLLLWQEQGGRSPYSGEHVSCADALSAHATEVDHIFPASRSLDDSQANKVLCFVGENREKGNRSPFEWLSGREDRWQHLTEIVWPDMAHSAHWPDAKRRRCMKAQLEQADDEGFTNRQLTDTSFIARAARDYLGLLFGGGQAGLTAVQVVPGRATAELRRVWGLGLRRLLHGEVEDGPKARDDHRHHAVDALTVALTGPGAVHQLSRWWQDRETTHTRPSFPPPWPDFRDAASAATDAIVVSHRVQAKLSGPLHEETHLGDTREMRGGARLFVKRKPVSGLTPGDLKAIRDPTVRNALEAAIASAGGDLRRALASEIRLPCKDGSPGPVIRRVRLLVPRNTNAVMSLHPTKNIHAELGPGTNDHIAIYRDGETVRFLVATRREAMMRARRSEPVVLAHHPKGGRLVMSLRQGDILHRRIAERDEYRLVRKFYGEGPIFFKPLTMATEPTKQESKTPPSWVREGWRKVAVDPIGRVRPAK